MALLTVLWIHIAKNGKGRIQLYMEGRHTMMEKHTHVTACSRDHQDRKEGNLSIWLISSVNRMYMNNPANSILPYERYEYIFLSTKHTAWRYHIPVLT